MASGDAPQVPLLQSWNPMLEDYESDFNSYDSGPGRDLPLSRQRPRRPEIGAGDMSASSPKTDDMIQLYVTGIPNEMNDDGLTNLFSQVGKVMYAHKCAATSTKFETSYGFVKFARPDEASAAIAKFNNFPIQQKYRLRVSIALNAEQKAQRAEQRKKQDEFLNSLSSANAEGSNDTTAPPGRMNGTPQNGHVAAPTSGSALGREKSTKTGTGLGKMPNVASTQFNQSPGVSAPGSGRGFNPCYSPIQGVVEGRVNGTAASVCGSDDGSVHSEGRRRAKRHQKPIGPCCVCKTAKGVFKCSQCKEAVYCGRECQMIDWPRHQLLCVKRSSQEIEMEKHFEVDVDYTTEEVHELLGQPLGPCKIADVARETLPMDTSTLVVVMDVIGPNNFCVVNESMTPQLQTLKDHMNLHYEGTVNLGPGSYVPVVNEVCAAQFKDDGEWYRVHVHRINLNATLDVTYVDFGNLETINVTDVRKIQRDMLRLPLQAVRCSLGVQPPSDVKEIDNFNKLSSVMLSTDKKYMCQPLGVTASGSIVRVTLQTLGGNKDIADFFVRQSKGVSFVSSPSTVSPRAMVSAVDPETVRPKSVQSVPLSQKGSPATKKPILATPAPPPSGPESVASLLPSASQSLPVVDGKTSLRVRVLEVLTPGHFLVHFLEGVNELEKLPALHRSMTEHYGAMPPNTVFKIDQNSLYAAKFSGDGLWYRALAYEPRGSLVCVQYLDYATRELVPFSQVHPLKQCFCVLPQQAVCCALAGIQQKSNNWPEDAAIAFRDELLVAGSVATICAYKKIQNVLMVELCSGLTPGGTTINKLLVSRGLAVVCSVAAPVNERNEKQVQTPVRKKVAETLAARHEKQVESLNTSPVRQPKKPSEVQPIAGQNPAFSAVKRRQTPTVAMLENVKLPTKSDQLMVTTSSGPADITVQFIEPDLVVMVQSLTEALAKANANYRGTYTPVNGELICAKFSEDNTWYRAEVIQVKGHGEGAHVRFVDYGNVDDVGAENMSALPEALLAYPVMGVKCLLAGVGPTAPGCQWDESLLKPFQLWRVTLHGKDAVPYSVELFDKDSGTSLNATLASSASFVSQDSKKGVMNLRNVKIPERDRIRIQVTDAVDSDHVNVQILEDDYILDLARLTEELSHIEPAGVGCQPEDIVCAKYSHDDKWYRAVVLESTSQGVKVRFIDYGNMETLPADQIAPVTDSLMQFPIMVVSCLLSGVGAIVTHDRWTSMLKLFEPMTMTVTGRGEGGRVIIELLDDANGPSLNEKLITSGVCTRAGVTTSTGVTASSVTMASSLGSMMLHSGDKLFKVQVVDASHGYELVTMQVLEGEFLTSLQELTMTLAEKYVDHPGGYQPTAVGELICAKFSSDNAWYRAEVVTLRTSGGNVLVRFVDFGNTEEVGVASIAGIDSTLLPHPVLGLCCCLAGVAAGPSPWDETVLKPFNPLDMRVVDASSAVLSVELFEDGHSLNEQLVKTGMLRSVEATANQNVVLPKAVKEVESKSPVMAMGEVKSSAPGVPKVTVKDLKRTELGVDQKSAVQVTSAPSPGCFTLQLLDSESLPVLAKLTTELLDYVGQSQGFNPGTGELVCAKFSQDGNWYRAEVTDAAAGKYTVRFVDFGNEDKVTGNDIGPMMQSLLQYPVMGVCCCLAGVAGVVAGQTWDPDSLRPFQGLLMSVEGHKNGVPAVRLSDPETRVDLNDDLVKRGVLAPATAMSTPETKSRVSKTTPTVVVPLPVAAPFMTIDSMRRVTLPAAEKMCVQVTDAASPGRITVQLLEKEYLADLASLTQVLIDAYSDYTGSYVPRVGEVVCAKFSGDWCRADVLALRPSGVVSVRFFDFGNVEEISCVDIATIADNAILGFPILGVPCRLGEAGPAWKTDLLGLFEAVLMTIVDLDSQVEPLVELFNAQTGTSFTEELVKSGALLRPAQKVAMPTKADLKKVQLPGDVGRVTVRVTDAYSPSNVTVQVLQGDSLSGLTALGDALAQCFASYSDSYSPQKGELVCAKFSQDNCWYRAEVLAVIPSGNIRVKFIDYGNSDEVTTGSVAKITPALFEYPVYGITCHLADVVGVANGKVWDPTLVRPFELLTLTVVSSDGDSYAIKLYDNADCLNVNLVNSGMLVGKQVSIGSSGSPVAPSAMRSPVIPSRSNNENYSKPLKSFPVSSAVKTSPVAQPPSYMKCLPMQDLPRDRPLVMPCFLEGPDEFYVQSLDADCVARFTDLTHALTEHYGLLEAVPYDPKLKELVAAYCVPDNAWYRAIVLEFYGETHYKVVFVDYGNADLVAVNGVRQLEPKFTKLPQQAIRVSLFGMNSTDVRWSGVAISGFSEEILNKACTLTITRKDGDVVVIADIAIEGKSVIDKMVSDGYLKLSDKMSVASGPSGGVVTSPKPAAVTMSDDNVNTIEDIVKISEIAVQQLPDTDEVTVLLAHAVSPGNFSVLMTDNKAAMEMHVKLNEHCKKTTSAYTNFVRDQVVCALYDNVWYRSAVIEAPSSGGLAKLCFFDFGNTERIPVENIRCLPRCFTSVPQQGIPCCLGSVAPFGQWSGKAVDWFTTLLNKCFKAKQLGYKDGRHRVDLRYDDQTGKNVAQEMISLQLATSVIAPDGQLTLAQRSNLTPVARKESALPSGRKTYRLSDLPKLAVTDEMEVVVVEVINPGLFFCHQAKKESMEALANLINQMDEHCNPLPVAVTFNPQPGEMCCAKYQGNWYRAVVEHRQGNTASVFFVDFGNIVTDDVSNLQPFCSQFCPIPSQAIRCSFAGLRPVGPDWTAEATETFKSLVATADSPVRLYMIVVNRSGNSGSLSVRLVDTTGDDVSGQDVGTQLVTRGVADSQDNNAPESRQSSSLEDKKARCLAEENAKLKQELEELRRMMQQQKL